MKDSDIKEILSKFKTIAMVGVSSEKKGEDKKNIRKFKNYCNGWSKLGKKR